MASLPLAFFTLDLGTASTAAALIAPVGGRFRLLAAHACPAGLPLEPLLGRLVAEVAEAEPGLLPDVRAWPTWTHLASATHSPRRALLAAATERRLADLETAVAGAGWTIVGRISPARTDALQGTALCLTGEADLLVIGAADRPRGEERDALPDLLALLRAALGRTDELRCLLTGWAAETPAGWPSERLLFGPAPVPARAAEATSLRALLRRLGERYPGRDREAGGAHGRGARPADGRRAFGIAIASLAALLGQRVEGVDVGASAGQRVLATPEGVRGELLRADAALVPEDALEDDRRADEIIAWSTLRSDPFLLRDRVRNLRLWPWRDAAGDGARLRLAAARAALARLDEAWRRGEDARGQPADGANDLIVASGGAFATAPAPAVSLALVDALRRPGGFALVYDHARVLAPLGALESEADRRRLLTDLLDDILVPLGSAIVAAGLRATRHPGSLRVLSDGGAVEADLVPGAVQVIDLPPGRTGSVELATREGAWLGVRARRVAIEVGGGLGGLLVDTRSVPLQLPERPERRRDLLAAWERPLWPDEER